MHPSSGTGLWILPLFERHPAFMQFFSGGVFLLIGLLVLAVMFVRTKPGQTIERQRLNSLSAGFSMAATWFYTGVADSIGRSVWFGPSGRFVFWGLFAGWIAWVVMINWGLGAIIRSRYVVGPRNSGDYDFDWSQHWQQPAVVVALLLALLIPAITHVPQPEAWAFPLAVMLCAGAWWLKRRGVRH